MKRLAMVGGGLVVAWLVWRWLDRHDPKRQLQPFNPGKGSNYMGATVPQAGGGFALYR